VLIRSDQFVAWPREHAADLPTRQFIIIKTSGLLAGRTNTMTSIKPIGDRVVVRPQAAEEKTSSGLFIPDTAKEKPQRGEVLFVGPGAVQDGKKVDMTVKAGDSVLYGKYSGTEITLDGEEVLIMRENDILGVIDEK
jgi:chaperonin GroES